MLKILYQLDKLDTIDANQVAEAANRLGVGEFQLFRLAHEEWFGAGVEEARLEPAFLDYMLQDQVPHYVRQYARNLIDRDDAGEIDPQADEFHRFDAGLPSTADRRRGAVTVLLVALFTAVFMGLTLYSYRPEVIGNVGCNFPPCPFVYERPAP